MRITEWKTVPLTLIDFSPFQARQYINVEMVKQLAKSIEEVGLLHPVTVRRIGERYQLIAGELRFRAIRDYTNEDTITVGVMSANDQESRRIYATENWLRNGG